jgi:hypothetical protein
MQTFARRSYGRGTKGKLWRFRLWYGKDLPQNGPISPFLRHHQQFTPILLTKYTQIVVDLRHQKSRHLLYD